ncbi:hypothetical protein [Rhodococcus sp. PD04]|uniref:hypothetical protein n=1 Tax=Rhodococcus sp. PD04 TaxID=3109594 RepID=UPI002DD83CDF|nr:hypothetical protein [Rhodococcus sp. PD04]WSE24379.1 hypothetical protein U9J23_08895 [Rhodococcus sp. PD04]
MTYRSQIDRWHDEPIEFAHSLLTIYRQGLTVAELQRRVGWRFNDRHRRDECMAEIERLIQIGQLECVQVDRSRLVRIATVGGAE